MDRSRQSEIEARLKEALLETKALYEVSKGEYLRALQRREDLGRTRRQIVRQIRYLGAQLGKLLFELEAAHEKLVPGQRAFLARLAAVLGAG